LAAARGPSHGARKTELCAVAAAQAHANRPPHADAILHGVWRGLPAQARPGRSLLEHNRLAERRHCSSWAGSGVLPAGTITCGLLWSWPSRTATLPRSSGSAAGTSAARMRSSVAAARGDQSSRELDLLRTAVQWADHARDRRHCLRVTEHVEVTHEEHLSQAGCGLEGGRGARWRGPRAAIAGQRDAKFHPAEGEARVMSPPSGSEIVPLHRHQIGGRKVWATSSGASVAIRGWPPVHGVPP
jgi:hypothetical protein